VGADERLLDRVRDRRQFPALHQHGRPARLTAAVGDLAQERALADPSGPVHEHHAGRRIVHEQLGDGSDLTGAADEGRPVAPRHPGAEGHS
jgi:hypothetical protein